VRSNRQTTKIKEKISDQKIEKKRRGTPCFFVKFLVEIFLLSRRGLMVGIYQGELKIVFAVVHSSIYCSNNRKCNFVVTTKLPSTNSTTLAVSLMPTK